MRKQSILNAVVLYGGVALAQTPEGFEPSTDTLLGVAFGTTAFTPGTMFMRDETTSPPSFFIPADSTIDSEGPFIIMIVDLDVPIRQGTTVTGRQELLHQLTIGYTRAPNGTLIAPPDASSPSNEPTDSSPAPYRPPMPPAERPPRPHRYVELLFAQPAGFEVGDSQEIPVRDRIGFNASTFVLATGLEPPLAGNYFIVTNSTAASTTGSGVLTPAPATSDVMSASASASVTATTTDTANASVSLSPTSSELPESTGGAARQVIGAISGLVAAGIAGMLL